MRKVNMSLALSVVIILILAGSAFSIAKALGTKTAAAEFSGCFIGVFREGAPASIGLIKKFEKETGKKPAVIMWYRDWSGGFPKDACDNARAYGAIPHIVWEPWYFGEMDKIKLDNIMNGQWDDYIRSWAKSAKAWGHPLLVRIGHEFNIDGYPWGVGNNGKDPQKYIKAFRHIVDIFKKEGAANVKWVWCFMNFSYPDEAWNDYEAAYPGDEYVDWIGIDGYNWGTTQTWSDWQNFKMLFREQMRRMTKLHPTKPIMVAEFACAEKGGDKAAWINEMPKDLKISMKGIKAVIWFDIRKETDWRITSSTRALAAFKQVMKDPYFSSSSAALESLVVSAKPRTVNAAKALKAKKTVKLDGTLSSFVDGYSIDLDKKDNLREGNDWTGLADLSGKIYVKWDENNLYIGAKVNDNKPLTNKRRRGDIWNGDAIELVMSTKPGADNKRDEVGDADFQIGFGTGDGKQNAPSIWIWQKRAQPKDAQIMVKKTSTGYILEAMVPWSSFTDYRPRANDTVGFDIALDDADKDERKAQLIWNGDYAFYKDPSVWGRLQFVE